MGKYDVKAEEDAIREVLAGRKDLDDVVRAVDEVATGDGIEGMLARLFAHGAAAPAQPDADRVDGAADGVYADPVAFLRDALTMVFKTPGAEPRAGGVSWREHPQHAIVEFVPTPGSAPAARRPPAVLPARAQGHRGTAAGDDADPRQAGARRRAQRGVDVAVARVALPVAAASRARLGGRPRAGVPRAQRGLRRRRCGHACRRSGSAAAARHADQRARPGRRLDVHRRALSRTRTIWTSPCRSRSAACARHSRRSGSRRQEPDQHRRARRDGGARRVRRSRRAGRARACSISTSPPRRQP